MTLSRAWIATLGMVAAVAIGIGPVPGAAENLDLEEMGAALALPILTGTFPGNPIKDTGPSEIIGGGMDVRACYETCDSSQTLCTMDVKMVEICYVAMEWEDEVLFFDHAVTLATVTNGKSEDILLKVDMINGDPESGGNWQSTSFECELTGRETTTFVFKSSEISFNTTHGVGVEAEVYVECSDDGDTAGAPKALFTNLTNGILFISAADPDTGETLSEDVIFGDAIVVDMVDGEAFSFGAIPFQAGSGLNDGDKVYRFDGEEYNKFPAVLATNFLAPTPEQEFDFGLWYDVNTELILFTLDGTAGNIPAPRVKLGGFAYNDDEMPFDFSYEFDCFDVVALEDINANFLFDYENSGLGLGSMSGHLEIVPQPIGSTGPDAHDAQYGDGNSIRRRSVHGWIVQNTNAVFVRGGHPVPGQTMDLSTEKKSAAWGRPLSQSTTDMVPFLLDEDTTLDADTRN